MANTLPITLGATRTLSPVTPLNQTKPQFTPVKSFTRKEDSVLLSPQAQAALTNQTVSGSSLDRTSYSQNSSQY